MRSMRGCIEDGGNDIRDREVQRTLMQLLAGMDGFERRGDVRSSGLTNRIDILDRALLTAGSVRSHHRDSPP